jgi:hypothetical protein
MRLLILLWKRAVILALGVFSIWLIVFVIFEFTDHRLPLIFAVGVTYGLGAYVVLPWVIRLGLMLVRQHRVPVYTTTGDGLSGDPVNIALIGTLDQLRHAFADLGWIEAEPLGLRSSWRMVRAFLLNAPYHNAPFSTLYLFGRGQDIGFQQPIGNSPRKRHHIRFWAVSLAEAEISAGTGRFWLTTEIPEGNEPVLWVGAATKDTGISLTRLSFQITHATDRDANAERDYVISALTAKQLIRTETSFDERPELPAKRINRYIFDGDVRVATLSN